ncbi:MAG: GNAT family N-acetyltransferase, partial [Candidatus Adiutrix sp.]
MEPTIRKATVNDVPAIYDILKNMAAKGLLLPRSLSNLYEMVQTFYVAEGEKGQLAGVAALQVSWEDLGEVRSLAVADEFAKQGLGRALTKAVERKAHKIGVTRMFVLTYVPGFFEGLGYEVVPLASLPQKIWAVC